MSQFFGQNFLKAQYFNANYLHGAQEEQTGRSGYYRLFFMKMQEEALRQYKEKTGKEVAEPVEVEGLKAKVVKVKPKTVKAKRPDHTEKEIVSKPKPIYRAVDNFGDILLASQIVSAEIHATLLVVPQYITALKVREAQLKQAANDAEIRVRLLLLAA